MSKHILFAATILTCLGAFTELKAQKAVKAVSTKNTTPKFLDNISADVEPVQVNVSNPKSEFKEQVVEKKTEITSASSIENASKLQLKYALLLDIEVEQVTNFNLFKLIDNWWGTRYRLGGNGKDGIDCSAFMQVLFASLYGITLPRTAKEQYGFSKRVSRTELKEGDLVFFNTIGGVSHVGMYLQNNKFVHASKDGVKISDLYEDYWSRHFIGVGRIDAPQQQTTALSLKP